MEVKDRLQMENYCNKFWPLVYDQSNHGRHEHELAFYYSELVSCSGPILEVACGTGMILLPLLEQGLDVYGFDLSKEMLEVLFAKAKRRNISDIYKRVTLQNMVDFWYDRRFEAIFIPARSFLHLTTRDEQVACLKNIHSHLRDGGKFMLNFFTPEPELLIRHTGSYQEFIPYGTFEHPETKEPIEVSLCQVNDLSSQIQYITCRFVFGGKAHETMMRIRWIYRSEFELLVRIVGFRLTALYGNFDKSPYEGHGEMIWILEKPVI